MGYEKGGKALSPGKERYNEDVGGELEAKKKVWNRGHAIGRVKKQLGATSTQVRRHKKKGK